MKNFILFILIAAFSSQISFSQKKFSCRVLDANSKEPIVYATVMLKKIKRGTHADFNGNFEIPQKDITKRILVISSIGYKTKEIPLSQLKDQQLNIMYLKTSNSSLDEVVIKTTKKSKRRPLAIQIVRKAIANILENYPTTPHSYIGYYKEYQQPVGNSYQKNSNATEEIKYLNVHEAIIESFDAGFTTDKLKNKKNQSLIYNYRNNTKFIQDTTLTVPYDNKNKKYSESVYISPLGGNELNILNLTNALRNHNKMSFSFSNVFNRDFINNHKFKVKRMVFSDKTPLYEISFASIKGKTSYEYAAYGNIYIAKQGAAIHKLNYNLYYRNKKNPQYAVTIEYLPIKDKMYLNYITFNNFFEANNGNYFKMNTASFNTKTNSIKIFFNRDVLLNSLEPIKRNFKIYYKDVQLKVLSVSPFNGNNKIVCIYIDKDAAVLINAEKEKKNSTYASYFKFNIENIKDLNGFKINERASLKMNQYREFFVQETFVNKKLPLKQNFIDKSMPLSNSLITPLNLENHYWLNTPLKSSKN